MKPSIADVQAHVSAHFSLPLRTMTDPSRHRAHTGPRQIAMYLARRMTGKSWVQIANHFHRDHTTIMHGVRRVDDLRRKDRATADTLRTIAERMGG